MPFFSLATFTTSSLQVPAITSFQHHTPYVCTSRASHRLPAQGTSTCTFSSQNVLPPTKTVLTHSHSGLSKYHFPKEVFLIEFYLFCLHTLVTTWPCISISSFVDFHYWKFPYDVSSWELGFIHLILFCILSTEKNSKHLVIILWGCDSLVIKSVDSGARPFGSKSQKFKKCVEKQSLWSSAGSDTKW